jgi:ubiquinone/menaquinone biosynthesis C-methylase UbiE
MEILELGCGTGSTALIHAPYVKHLHAIDYSAKMIEIARHKAKMHNINNITFEQMDVESLSVPNQSLDVVLGLSLLHLLENKEEVITKVYNMLKPGGIFITSPQHALQIP